MDRKGRAPEKALCTEETVQVLQVSYVQAGGQSAKRTWQDLYNLSEVPGAVRETQLATLRLFGLYYRENGQVFGPVI